VLQFEKLYQKLDQTTKTTEKVEALVEFFHLCPTQDKIWIIALFTGRRPKRSVPLANLRQWAAEFAEIPQWLFDESYHTVGDLAETISLVLGKTSQNISPNLPLDSWIQRLHLLKNQTEDEQRNSIFAFWNQLSTEGRFLLNKLITGGFRIGVSQALLTQALSKYTGIPKDDLTFRISGKWDPFKTNFDQLILNSDLSYSDSKPYPFFLAYPIPEELLQLNFHTHPTNSTQSPFHSIENWQFEYKWDGIRGQLILRNNSVTLWSRGEEIISIAFPEIIESIASFRGMLMPIISTKPCIANASRFHCGA
jgi:DNA ligase-1